MKRKRTDPMATAWNVAITDCMPSECGRCGQIIEWDHGPNVCCVLNGRNEPMCPECVAGGGPDADLMQALVNSYWALASHQFVQERGYHLCR
ncbi:MAG: hypothetical protein WD069_01355 [Planctomycetales bacterium]